MKGTRYHTGARRLQMLVVPMTSSANSSGGFRIPNRASTVGASAVARWLHENRVEPSVADWSATITIRVVVQQVPIDAGAVSTTHFQLHLEPDSWGLRFFHAGSVSCIRVADIACIDGCDQHQLLFITPQLRDLGRLLRQLEHRHALRFHRDALEVRTNVPSLEEAAMRWLARL
jgi:hypothetical protein